MLSRLLRISSDENTIVVPLIDISDRNRSRVANPRVSFIPLQMDSAAGALSGTLKLARLISRKRPRVIVCWMYHAMIAGTIARRMANYEVPLFWNVRQSLDDPLSLSRNTRSAVWAGRLLSGYPTGTIYNSERALKLHGDYGYRNSNAIVIPNGFDIPEGITISSNSPRIFGIAGRFHPQKDYQNFFLAAAAIARKFPSARFKAAGKGLSLNNPAVARILSDVGMPVGSLELCGEVFDMDAFYRSIDVLVLSSRTEGFPNVVAEAMSYAKPVIATDVGDAAKIVGGIGWVVPARDPVALGAALEQALCMSPDKYASVAVRARRKILEEFDMISVRRRYENFLSCGPL